MSLPVELPPDWPAMTIAEAHARLTAPGARFELEEKVIRGIKTRVWKNAPPTLRDVLLACRAYRDREFVVYEDERVSFAAFERAVAMLAHELQAQGVAKGDRVALLMRNLPEWPVAFFASAALGAVIVPLNAWWTSDELCYGLANCGAKVAIMDAQRYERLEPHMADLASGSDLMRVYVSRLDRTPSLAHVTMLESVLGLVNDWQRLPLRELPSVALHPEDDAVIVYSSGTTGRPKGVLSTHRNYTASIMTLAFATARACLRRGQTPPFPTSLPQRVTLLAVPLFHVTGCNSALIPAVAGGNKLVLMHKWNAERALQLIERERVTVSGGVPTIAWQLIEHPQRRHYDLSSIEALTYGGAPAAPELAARIKLAFPRAYPGNGWGMTETSGSVASITAEDYLHRPASCGVPAAVCEIKIMSPDGSRELPAGEAGELWVKGPMVAKAYWNDPVATAQSFIDGWLRTGDIVRVDAEGFMFIVDRAKDMVIRGGENIYCIEVEHVLHEHPAVMEAAVIGIAHPTLGEEPAAVVVLEPQASVTEEQIRQHVAQRLAAFKVPVKVAFWPQALPRNPAGKVLKTQLKSAFEER